MDLEAIGQPYDDFRLRFTLANLTSLLGAARKGGDGKPVAWAPADFLLPWERDHAPEARSVSPAADVELPDEEDRVAPLSLYRRRSLSPEASVNAAMIALRGRVERVGT